jgi:hypothetical protein
VAELLDDLATVPSLHGAACTSHRALFDACLARGRPGDAVTRAVQVCAGCPVLLACARWVAELPPNQRPYGVVGGKFRGQRTR